ncbi:MAG: translation initiation factor IF-2 [Spirochaetae bacterium HGW-Spirochaetae-8]|nr:MAG: translation initiation factor IF-2 [Spirochaetae bacterium HGW-Spirochaetae-8]
MTEEQNKPKTTLIKHAKGTATQPTPVTENKEVETAKTFEKKKVVVVKKKVVVVRPQVRTSEPASKTSDSESEQSIQTTSLPSASSESTQSSDSSSSSAPVKSETHFRRTPHVGPSAPVVRSPQNLPPVPNQGQTAADHAEWKTRNPQGITPSASANKPQGIVGGVAPARPISDAPRTGYQGNRPAYGSEGQNRPSGYQGNRPAYGPDGQPRSPGYQGNRPAYSSDGQNRPSGYQGNRPAYGPDSQNRNIPASDDTNKPVQTGDETTRPSTGYQGNRPAYGSDGQNRPTTGYQGNRPAYGSDGQNRPTTGYQGNRPAYGADGQNRPATGYQGTRPPYNNGGAPRPGGYQGTRPPYAGPGGPRPPYSGPGGPRPPYNGPGGPRPPYNGPGGPRPPYNGPGGPRPPYQGGRPGGFGGPRGPRTGGPGGSSSDTIDPLAQKTTKKVFKKKKDDFKKPERDSERDFQIKRKDSHRVNPVPKKIDMMEVITVSDLARKMNLKASEIIGKLFKMGMMVTINQQIDSDTASIIASEYDCEVNIVSLYDETLIASETDAPADVLHRAPIVTIMGHVDHGKTKLLDAIRSTNVVAGEFGGITQHIGAYKVALPGRGDVVFLDTPGHAAFTMMRARGAQLTDIVVLVVAANDGVMPQTREAIDHAKAAKVPIIVAVNKIDLPEANIDRVKQQLSDLGLMPEEWGGNTLYCEISALKKLGIEELLDTILLQAEMLELTANANTRAEGKVLESRIDQGRGIVATVIIERGTLRQGDNFVAGIYAGKVRAIFNDRGARITEAGPATPVEVIGLSDIPGAGDPFQVTENEKQARQVGTKRQELERLGQAKNVKKITLDNIFDKMSDGEIQELNVIIKGDVQGSVEAVQNALEKLSTKEIRLNVLRASAGAIIEDDINLAIASQALVLGFNVRPTPKAQTLAEQEKIEIRKYNIIYDAVDDIRAAMEGMLTPDRKEIVIGKVEVRETFHVPKIGLIAGCYVLDGKIRRNAQVNVIRENIKLHSGKISSLKRFKDDAREVVAGFECGVGLENFQNLQAGDILEIVDVIEVAKKLTSNE